MDNDTFDAIREAITAELERAHLSLEANFMKLEEKKALSRIVRNLIAAFPLLGQASAQQPKWVEKALTQLGHSAVNAVKQQTKIKKESESPALPDRLLMLPSQNGWSVQAGCYEA